MAADARKVLARYREDPNNIGLDDHDVDPITHMKEESAVMLQPAETLSKLVDIKKLDKIDKTDRTMKDVGKGISVNPYDYADPSTSPKQQGESAPFVNEVLPDIGRGYYNKPELFEKDKSLDPWLRAREQDWTSDEDQQNPAISLTRSPGALQASDNSFLPTATRLKTAASISEIISRDSHYKNSEKVSRAGTVAISLVGNDEQRSKGLFSFRARGSSGRVRRVYFQFLRPKSTTGLKSLMDYPVQISCNCESFLYHGAQYYAIHDRYLYGPGIPASRRTRNIAPTPESQISSYRFTRRSPGTPNISRRANPGRGVNFRVCKHILAAYNFLQGRRDLLRVKKQFRKFELDGPPLPFFDKKVWKELMGFEFNASNVKKQLSKSKPITPSFFKSRSISRKFIEWMRDVWLPRTDDEKVRVLQTLVEHPEEIYLIMLKDAYYTSGKTSRYLIDTAFDLMDRVVQQRTPDEIIPDPTPSKIEELRKEEDDSAKKDKYITNDQIKQIEESDEEFIEKVDTHKQWLQKNRDKHKRNRMNKPESRFDRDKKDFNKHLTNDTDKVTEEDTIRGESPDRDYGNKSNRGYDNKYIQRVKGVKGINGE